uniref:Uncharacterized protein n=1 Tax=Arundo donax TaxID=35708 RepID=A0A0A9FDC2_ARUDO
MLKLLELSSYCLISGFCFLALLVLFASQNSNCSLLKCLYQAS